jgi:hypothetical protein
MAGAENAFFCNQKKYTVHLSYSFDEDNEVGIFRMNISSTDREAGFAVNSHESDIQDMRDLYASASVSAAGFENIENDFFDD